MNAVDRLLLALNIGACLALASFAAWAVLSPRVRDGVVIKVGLILAAMGFAGLSTALAAGHPLVVVVRALGLLHVGLVIIAGGWVWRQRAVGNRQRRVSDWMDLPDLDLPPGHDRRAPG